jgi:hypothetical protein
MLNLTKKMKIDLLEIITSLRAICFLMKVDLQEKDCASVVGFQAQFSWNLVSTGLTREGAAAPASARSKEMGRSPARPKPRGATRLPESRATGIEAAPSSCPVQ